MSSNSFTVKTPTAVVWDPSLLEYRFSATHPMDPVRLDLTQRLCRELGIFGPSGVPQVIPDIATDELLETVHAPEYISAVKRAAEGEASDQHGLGTEDTPCFGAIHSGAARIAGGTVRLAEMVSAGEILHGVNFAGGMHHAGRARAGGFCVYNDAALAIRRLLDLGASRVVYLDVDAHHGDGTQEIFLDDPSVMTISLHQSGVSLYPGTGFPNEVGGSGAEGGAVNIALPAGIGDAGWQRAFHAVVPQLVRAFEPDVIVSQHGCDGHWRDPLSDLRLSLDGQRQTAFDIEQLAQDHCGGRWIATGGGGYSVFDVVPRSWAHLTAIAAGDPIPLVTAVPESWLDYVRETYGDVTPRLMGDDAELWWRSWELGYDPGDPVDRAVMQTRKEVFPLYGLDPWFD